MNTETSISSVDSETEIKEKQYVLYDTKGGYIQRYITIEGKELRTKFDKPKQCNASDNLVLVSEKYALELQRQYEAVVYVTDWSEISLERYNELYHMFPVMNESQGIFRFLEPVTYNVAMYVAKYGDKYYSACKLIVTSYDVFLTELEQKHNDVPT